MLPAEPFRSDGCTFFPDSWDIGDGEMVSLLPPCVDHDYAYWVGGTEADRLKADETLRDRVDALGGPGNLMYWGVRIGGGRAWPVSPMPNRHHWGYGWPKDDYGAGYAAA